MSKRKSPSAESSGSSGSLWIPGRLPGLNDILDARRTLWKTKGGRVAGDGYTSLKKLWTERIALCARSQGFRVIGARWTYLFCEPDRRRDPSNLIAGGVKLIEDALQELGLLDGDGWQQVVELRCHYISAQEVSVHKSGVLVVTRAWEILGYSELFQQLQVNAAWKKQNLSDSPAPWSSSSRLPAKSSAKSRASRTVKASKRSSNSR